MHLCEKIGMCDPKYQLKHALDTALAQFAETMGEAFPIVPILDVVDDPEFWATAEMRGDAFCIQVSTGIAHSISALWAFAYADEEFSGSFGQAVCSDAEAMTHISLVWLMLHEMHHFQMGHFEGNSTLSSRTTAPYKERGLVTRAKNSTTTRSVDVAKPSQLLEMQADHDATEMLLDAYSTDEWISLRVRVAAISAMMMLIERAKITNHESPETHPKAATRIFQLLGHVMDMPMYSVHPDIGRSNDGFPYVENLTLKKEHECFAADVVVPTFFDAVSLAKVVSAQSIINDLGSATDFFQDVQAAKLVRDAGSDTFVTVGARQWAELVKSRD